MPFPKTRDELVAQGYKFSNHTRCKSCQETIEFWETPRGKKMPFDHMQESSSPTISHFSTCQEADLFRKPRQ